MNPNYQGPFGNTLLHGAVANNDVREVKRLLAAGADPRVRNREGRTPLQVAKILRKPRVAAVLRGASSLPEVSDVSSPARRTPR